MVYEIYCVGYLSIGGKTVRIRNLCGQSVSDGSTYELVTAGIAKMREDLVDVAKRGLEFVNIGEDDLVLPMQVVVVSDNKRVGCIEWEIKES